MNSNFRNLALWVIIVLLLLALFTLSRARSNVPDPRTSPSRNSSPRPMAAASAT